jgi:hypothetical protein
MEAQMQKHVPISLTTKQAKARNLFEDLKRKYPGDQAFVASTANIEVFIMCILKAKV